MNEPAQPPASPAPGGKGRVWIRCLGLLCAMLLCAIGYSYLEVWRANRALAWETTSGTVVESKALPGCGSRTGNGYYVTVRYNYRVDGIERESRRIRFGESTCASREEAKAFTSRFPVGPIAAVRYDPQAPAQAVLIPGEVAESTWTGIYFLIFWLSFVGPATAMAVVVERSKRNPRRGLPPQRELGGR